MLLIKNGRVVDPVTNTDRKLDVLVDGAVIAEVAEQIDADACRKKYGTDDVRVIDAEGLVVAPGLVDTHVHFRDPGFTYNMQYPPDIYYPQACACTASLPQTHFF